MPKRYGGGKMRAKGRAYKFGDNVNTDEIIPAKFLNTVDPEELASHCMEGIRKNFAKHLKKGGIIVAGRNFGCGSSREHAPFSIKSAGISCVIASSFARIFYRNSINIALPILESKEASKGVSEGDIVEIDFQKGEIKNITRGVVYKARGFPDFMERIIKTGGLLKYVAK